MCAQFFWGGTPGMIYGGMWMPLAFALHHEQNMPAVKVKYTLRRTQENVLNHILFTCAMCDNFLVANGRPAGCLGGLGQSNMDYSEGRVLFSFAVCANGTLPKSSGRIRRVCVKPFGECKVNYKLSGQTLCLVRLCVKIRLFTRLCKFIMSWRDSSSATFWWHFRWRQKNHTEIIYLCVFYHYKDKN